MRVVVVAAALYLVAPGHPDVPGGGLPLGQIATTLLIGLIGALIWTRDVSPPRARPLLPGMAAVVIVAKLAIAALAPHSGWLAQYYANDQFTPPAQRSTDFRGLNATRIDRQLSFADTAFPVHFFNEAGFNFGFRREATQGFAVHWRGHFRNDERVSIEVDSRGPVDIEVDGRLLAAPLVIDAGDHVVDVRYRKPPESEGLLRVIPHDGAAPRPWRIGEVTPAPATAAQRSLARALARVAWLLHAAIIVIAGMALRPFIALKMRSAVALWKRNPLEGLHAWVGPAVLIALVGQGLWKSRHLVDQVWTLTGGDDWWAFEASAREAILNGWQILGARPGAFNTYPGYSYFVAMVHVITGEALAGPILMNFAVLAVATLLVYATARRLTSPLAAMLTLMWLLVLEQLAFVRYYTVTLLSENLFLPFVAAAIYLLARFQHEPRWSLLAGAGVCGGLATVTRPTMLLYLPAAAVIVMVGCVARGHWRRAAAAAAVLATTWMLAVAPVTMRNYLVTGRVVLVTEGQGQTFVDFNLPPGDNDSLRKYYEGFTGSNLSAARTLLWILWDHPGATLRQWGEKLGFSLGMVHWRGSAPHPELILTSVLYAAAIVLLRSARTIGASFVHAFVATHLATLLLSMPWNYGYRMLLAMYLVMPVFSAAVIARPLQTWLGRRRPAWVAGVS